MQTVRFDHTDTGQDHPTKHPNSRPQAEPAASPSAAAPTTADLSNTPPSSPRKGTQPKANKPGSFRASGNGATQTRPLESSATRFVFKPSGPCWLTVHSSRRHISLPATGELILGRFDPTLKDPPDVDLTFEDGEARTVSRRHARLVGREGYHTIEDLGSSNGLFVNATQVEPGHPHPLQPGDQIFIGELEMSYTPVPDEILQSDKKEMRHFVLLGHTGRRISIEPPNGIMIGRTDPAVDILPTIDLSQEGDVSLYVSRRHAVITWSGHKPYIKDAGSTFGTRRNGQLLPPGQPVGLNPGDHISLGGCVLVYDVVRMQGVQTAYLTPPVQAANQPQEIHL